MGKYIRLLLSAAAIVLALTLPACTALAADGDFVIENGVLINYNGSGGDVTIPDSVTGIGDRAFADCTSLTSVTIPEGVTDIGNRAFQGCAGLVDISIPGSVNRIGYSAFYHCHSLTNITIPDGVTKIDGKAFAGCNGLTRIVLPASATQLAADIDSRYHQPLFVDSPNLKTAGPIGSGCNIEFGWTDAISDYAFYECTGLTSVTIPDSVTSIGGAAFFGCSSLANVYYLSTASDWNKITIYSGNGPLTNAIIHYNVPSDVPSVPMSCAIQPGGALDVALEANQFSGSGVVSIATYSAEGQMLGLRWVNVSDMSKGYHETVSQKIDPEGTYKVFLLDGETHLPLTSALTGRSIIPKSPRELIFELLRDYAKSNGTVQEGMYVASLPVQGYYGQLSYLPDSDEVGIGYVNDDAAGENVFVSVIVLESSGEISEYFFRQSEAASGMLCAADFALDPARFDGMSNPAVTEYTDGDATGQAEFRFKGNARHAFTQLLVVLDKFLTTKDYSIADLGFTAFVPENFPSQNIAFNELVHYAMTGSQDYSGVYRKEKSSNDWNYYVEYDPDAQTVSLGHDTDVVTCDTKIKIHADMRQPYDVEMRFFRYSGIARTTINPKTYTANTPIRFTGVGAGNTDWENECKYWVDITLDMTKALPLGLETVTLGLEYLCTFKDLGFMSYVSAN